MERLSRLQCVTLILRSIREIRVVNKMIYLFIDTNIFIQCCDFDQLPWKDIFDQDEHILIYIPRAVEEEISRLKQDGNSRRAQRARKANSFMKQILFSKDKKLGIRDSKPTVEIAFTPPLIKNINLPDFLDSSLPDDRIISEVMTYRNNYPTHNVSIITHDTIVLRTAMHCDIPYFTIPDNWLLPPETDSKDKRILELESLIKELQSNYPVIEIYSVDDTGNEVNHFSIEVVKYSILTENELDELLNMAKRRYPLKTNFTDKPLNPIDNRFTLINATNIAMGNSRKFIPPSSDQIEKYQNEEYPAWIDKVKTYLLSLPEEFEESTRSLSFSVQVNNNGNVPAENVIVEFEALGDIYLGPSPETDASNAKKSALTFPSPPKPPEGHWITQRNSIFDPMGAYRQTVPGHISFPVPHSILEDFPNIFARQKRDKNEFYRKNGKPERPLKFMIFECEEFRHQTETASFDLTVLMPPTEKEIVKSKVECSVSAKNLPKPIKFYISIDIVFLKGNTFEKIKKYLNRLNVL